MRKSIPTIVLLLTLGVHTGAVAQKNSEGQHYQYIASLCEAIKENPTNTAALYDRGLRYIQVGEYEKAMDDAERGMEIQKDIHRFHYLKGLILYKRKHYNEAINEINTSLLEMPNDLEYLFFKAILESNTEDYREAILTLDKMLQLDKQLDYCYLQKAIWCEKMNMYYESIKNYLYFIRISTDQTNIKMCQSRLDKLVKSDHYFRDLHRNAKKEIKEKGYPWDAK